MDVSIVVVSHNSGSDLLHCLQSIVKKTKGIEYEIIVVDNASSDNSIEQTRKRFLEIRIIENERNLGFGVACNQGWQQSKGRYIYFLNPDSRLANNAPLLALRFADVRDDVGIVGTKVLNNDGTVQLSCRSFPSLATGLFNRYSILSRLWPKNLLTRKYLCLDSDHSVQTEVDWVSGASMFVRHSVLEQTDGFDEDYFLYCEDVDICLRTRKIGWKIWYLPNAVVHHSIGSSTSKARRKAEAARHRSMWIYYQKHFRRNIVLDMFVFWGIFLRNLCKILF